MTKIVIGGKVEDIDGGDGDGDDEDDKKENVGHLVPVEHHQGLDNDDGGRRKG